MNTRNIRNSQSAAFDALSLAPESGGIPPRSVSASSAWLQLLHPCVHLLFCPRLLPFLLSSPTLFSKCFLPSKLQVFLLVMYPQAWPTLEGGVTAPQASSSQLAAQASSFATSGAGFASSLAATVTPPASGRPNNCVVPTFVSTFSTPILLLAHSAFPGSLHAALPSSTTGAAPLAPLPGLHQPFMVGPGFSPVPAKLVSQIVAGKFVELHE